MTVIDDAYNEIIFILIYLKNLDFTKCNDPYGNKFLN